jgi:MinD-like ATPase involved in chromosome partitioning or flagellar assembly
MSERMSARLLIALSSAQEARFVTTVGAARSVQVARRCADLPDLLAAAAAGLGTCAAVSPDLPHLERDVVDRLTQLEIAVLGVTAAGDEAGERRLRQLGVERVVTSSATSTEIESAVEDLLARRVPGLRAHRIPAPDAFTDPEVHDPEADAELDRRIEAALGGDLSAVRRPVPDGASKEDLPAEDPAGQVIAVWGPIGAPGRTTVALTLAAEYAAAGSRVLLIDADTYGSSVAQALGLLDDVPGLAAAARAAEQGTLDAAGLLRRAPEVVANLRVLTGLPRADRWPEVRDGAMSTILDIARRVADVIVVDCGFGLEADEELSFDTAAPRRNATTLTTLEQADHLVAVGAGEPIGLQRLVRGLTELGHVSSPPPRVVVTRVRVSAAGPGPAAAVRDVLGRFSGIEDVVIVPDDREACDAAMLAGRTLVEHAPTSPARLALREVARELLPERVTEPATRRARRRRAG